MPKSRKQNVVIDTNLWISFLISRSLQKLDHLLLSDKICLLFSIELLDEIKATVTKPKLAKYFSKDAMEEMICALNDYIKLVIVTSKVQECRDIKDDFLLALSKDGNADFLVTGDKDLLVMKKYSKTKIVTISDFLVEMKKLPLA